jgi:allophycocyanin-B
VRSTIAQFPIATDAEQFCREKTLVEWKGYSDTLDIMSVVSQVILKADDELRYPSSGELKSISEFLKTGEQRIRIAQTLADSEKKIVQEASRKLWQRRPDFIAPGGNAYGQRERNQCLRDYGWYLRLVTYGVLAGDKEPIESIGLIGAREMYNSLGVPVPGMVEAIRCLKEAALGLLSVEDAATTEPYFDYLIQGMAS